MISFAQRAAAGLAILAHALFVLALIGQLRPIPIAVALIAALIFVRRFPPLAVIAVAAPLFLLAMHPPLAFDETLYHLPTIRALAESGQLRFVDTLRFPVFPQLQELLCVPVYLFAGDTATHLVSLLETALAAALMFEWRGALAAAFLLGSPIVVHLATITYVDAALMLFVLAAFYCLDRREFAWSGFFLGTACSVKYLGGYFAVAALIIAFLLDRRGALKLAATCAAAALPTTLWIWIKSGDPVFPFGRPSIWSHPMHTTWSWRVLWDVTFARARVNHEPPMTPFLIVALIVLLFHARRDVRARWVIALVAIYLAIFSFLPQDTRYLVPLLPLIAAALPRFEWRWLAWIAIAPGILYVGYRYAQLGLPRDRELELLARVPEYRALRHADDGLVYVCGGEQLKSYARGELLGDFFGPYSFDRVLRGDGLRRIRARWLLISKRACESRPDTRGMILMYEDPAAQLWRIPVVDTTPRAPVPHPPASPPSPESSRRPSS